MKRYLLFAGETYYPSGGWDDFVGDYATEAEAKAARPTDNDWAHIVDGSEREIIAMWAVREWLP